MTEPAQLPKISYAHREAPLLTKGAILLLCLLLAIAIIILLGGAQWLH